MVQIAIFEVNPIYSFVVGTINSNYTNGLGFAAAVVIVYSAIVLAFVGVIFLVLRTKDDTKISRYIKGKTTQTYRTYQSCSIEEIKR